MLGCFAYCNVHTHTHQQVNCYLLEFAPGLKQQVVWKFPMKHCTSSDRIRHALCTLWCSGLAQTAHRGYDTMSLSEWFRTFQRILQPLSSRVNESNNTSGQYNFFFSKRRELKRHILEDVNPQQQQRCDSVKCCNVWLVRWFQTFRQNMLPSDLQQSVLSGFSLTHLQDYTLILAMNRDTLCSETK